MKKAIGLLVLCFISLSGCQLTGKGVEGSGNRQTEKRDLKSFNAIDTSGAYEVEVTCQQPANVAVEADDNILPLIKTEVRDGVLFVTNDRSYHSSKLVTLRISLPDLNKVATHGAGKVNVANINDASFKVNAEGAATIDLTGKTKNLEISSAGAGKIAAGDLHAEKASVQVTGAASIDVYATEQLDVTVSGAGAVSYGGNPKVLNKNITGFGSLNKKE